MIYTTLLTSWYNLFQYTSYYLVTLLTGWVEIKNKEGKLTQKLLFFTGLLQQGEKNKQKVSLSTTLMFKSHLVAYQFVNLKKVRNTLKQTIQNDPKKAPCDHKWGTSSL